MRSPYFFCRYSLSPLRAEASDASEMVSQVFFGEIIEQLEIQHQWVKVRQLKDNYEGWLDKKFLAPLTEKEMIRWMDQYAPTFSPYVEVNTTREPLVLSRGAYLPYDLDTKEFQIGNEHFEIASPRLKSETDIVKIAKSYHGAPYLWGGKSLFGIDCSGLTQMVLRFLDKNIPRDASQQVEDGMEIEFKVKEAGDLVFFINQKDKIHHVGIYIGDDQIIHAHGCVRIDKLTREGIISTETDELSHQFYGIKRV